MWHIINEVKKDTRYYLCCWNHQPELNPGWHVNRSWHFEEQIQMYCKQIFHEKGEKQEIMLTSELLWDVKEVS